MAKTKVNFKTCTNCKELKSWDAFTLQTKNKRPRSMCKACRSRIEILRVQERNITLKPSKFHQCENDNCMNIYSKKMFSECPKCGLGTRGLE